MSPRVRSALPAVTVGQAAAIVGLILVLDGWPVPQVLAVAVATLGLCGAAALVGESRGTRTGHSRANRSADLVALDLTGRALERAQERQALAAQIAASHPAARPADYVRAEVEAEKWAQDAESLAVEVEPSPEALAGLADATDCLRESSRLLSHAAALALWRRAVLDLMRRRAEAAERGEVLALDVRDLAAIVTESTPAGAVLLRRNDSGPPGSTTLDRLPPSTRPRSGLSARALTPEHDRARRANVRSLSEALQT